MANNTDNFKKNLRAELPDPSTEASFRIVKQNDRYEMHEKQDGTYSIRVKLTGDESGHYTSEEEANKYWDLLVKEQEE
ncbi:MAG: hypothetical protein J6X27_01610 [Bacteroidaceae bacterium]|nr:hypothetical protein [Bacteroidaceae bacterium]